MTITQSTIYRYAERYIYPSIPSLIYITEYIIKYSTTIIPLLYRYSYLQISYLPIQHNIQNATITTTATTKTKTHPQHLRLRPLDPQSAATTASSSTLFVLVISFLPYYTYNPKHSHCSNIRYGITPTLTLTNSAQHPAAASSPGCKMSRIIMSTRGGREDSLLILLPGEAGVGCLKFWGGGMFFFFSSLLLYSIGWLVGCMLVANSADGG